MARLAEDTMFYRHDHPDGFIFGAGNPEPDPAEGWVTSPDEVPPPPEKVFECATLEEFAGVLANQRLSNQHLREQLVGFAAENQTLKAEVVRLVDIIRGGIAAAQAAEAAQAKGA